MRSTFSVQTGLTMEHDSKLRMLHKKIGKFFTV